MRYRTVCLECETEYDLDTESVNFTSFPVAVICPYCEATQAIESSARLKRIPPAPTSNHFLACSIMTESEIVSTVKPKPVEQDKILPFWKQANEIAEHVRELASKTQQIRVDLDNFTKYVIEFFSSQWQYATNFARRWRPGYVQEFLSFPFISLPVKCDDDLAGMYSRWVLAPKFFNPGFGYRVHPNAGFRLEVVNQYSRLQFPLENEFLVKMNLPPNLMLEVKGDKIIGRSLFKCWEDIPGLVKDADHTPTEPSVRIENSMLARTWLARHAVLPWSPRPIEPMELHATEFEDDLKYKSHFHEPFKQFLESGRVGVYWSNALEARRFAALAGAFYKGTTAVLMGTQEDKMSWDATYTNLNKKGGSRNEFVYFSNGESINWIPLMRCPMIVLDNYHEVDGEIIDRLFDYKGRLIVIGSDPLMDFDTANIIAAKLHALTGWHFSEFLPDEEWPERDFIHGLEEIKGSLFNLCNNRIRVSNPV